MKQAKKFKILSLKDIMDMDDDVRHDDYLNPSQMPYGMWRQADGREVIFNRQYIPMFERNGGGGVRKILEYCRINFEEEHFFRDDATHNPREAGEKGKASSSRCIDILIAFLCSEDLSKYYL